jgi:hypothetical protein
MRQLKLTMNHGQIMPDIPKMEPFFSTVGTALQFATTGLASAKEAFPRSHDKHARRSERKPRLAVVPGMSIKKELRYQEWLYRETIYS